MLSLVEKPETIIALFSLLMSAATFVFVYLRPSQISTFLGPTIIFGYTDTEKGTEVAVQLPVTFINNGAKAGSVFRTAILLYNQNQPNERYFMQWHTFLKLDTQQIKPRWVHEEVAHVLMLPSNSSVARLVLFIWYSTSKPPLKIREGSYNLEFLFWINDTTLPHYETHQISVSSEDVAVMEDRSDPASRRTVTFQLNQQLEINRFIKNEFDARALREQPLKNLG